MVVHILFEMPQEGSWSRMGAQLLVRDVSSPVLPVVPARSPDPGSAHNRVTVLGRSFSRDGQWRETGRANVQHCRAGGFRILGRMGFSHAHVARTRRHALGRHSLPEHRTHTRNRPLQGICIRLKVSIDGLNGNHTTAS